MRPDRLETDLRALEALLDHDIDAFVQRFHATFERKRNVLGVLHDPALTCDLALAAAMVRMVGADPDVLDLRRRSEPMGKQLGSDPSDAWAGLRAVLRHLPHTPQDGLTLFRALVKGTRLQSSQGAFDLMETAFLHPAWRLAAVAEHRSVFRAHDRKRPWLNAFSVLAEAPSPPDEDAVATRQLLESLHAAGVSVVRDPWERTPLMNATRHAAMARFEGFLDHFQALTDTQDDREGLTLLHIAAATNEPEKVRALLARGADPRACNANGQHVLLHAVASNAPASVHVLLEGEHFDEVDLEEALVVSETGVDEESGATVRALLHAHRALRAMAPLAQPGVRPL